MEPKASVPEPCPAATPNPRRGFLVKLAAIVIGSIVAIFPFAAGLFTLFDPVRRPSKNGEFLRVTTLNGVPADGLPHLFAIASDKWDVWNRYPQQPLGVVYLTRQPGDEAVTCLSSVCPHAGCMVMYQDTTTRFNCPCHDSVFDREGKRMLEISQVPPRDMDPLPVEIKNGVVWVEFQNFQAGVEAKIGKG